MYNLINTRDTRGQGASLTVGELSTGAIKKVSVSDAGVGYTSDPNIDTSDIGDGNAIIIPNRSGFVDYPGKFNSADGFISDIIKIQDSFYYQDFSYVLKSEIQTNDFRDLVKSFVHPAGWYVFGELTIILSMALGIQMDAEYHVEIPPVELDRTSIKFDSSYLHQFHVEFLDPTTIPFHAFHHYGNFAHDVISIANEPAITPPAWYDESRDAKKGILEGLLGIEYNVNYNVNNVPWYPNLLSIIETTIELPPQDAGHRGGYWQPNSCLLYTSDAADDLL